MGSPDLLDENEVPPDTEPPSLRLRDSVAARIAALVVLVLVAAGVSAISVLGQLRAFQARFDLLTEVYVVFNQRLAEANVQAVRVHEQVRRASDSSDVVDPAYLRLFEDALRARQDAIAAARAPIDQALADPEHYGGPEQLEQLERLVELLDELEQLTAIRDVDPVSVLRDVPTQNQVSKLFKTLSSQSEEAVDELGREVRQAQVQTERLTLGLTLVTTLVGLFASLGVALTLRPLRQLTAGVRRLSRGDWAQRVRIAGSRRGDEVTQLATEFNHMASALEERERRLLKGERLAAAGQLAAQITHEIRNPLSSVGLNVELLEDELVDPSPEARHLFGEIAKEIDRLTQVTEEYLSFARRPKPDLQRIDLRDELRSLCEFMRAEIQLGGVALRVDLPASPVIVMGDANQLRQAFMNLIRNATEAALDEERDDDRAPAIAVGMHCKDDEVIAFVEDDGPGIPLPADSLERIFEAFYTRKARGTGLGLPTVQQILADHGGSVRVAHTGPSGTRFEVVIPACAQDGPPVSSEPAKVPTDAAEQSSRAARPQF